MSRFERALAFISYQLDEAKHYADHAKRIFEGHGFRTWVWHHNRKHYGYVLDDIMDAIEACDFFVYICTAGSDSSRGQSFERDYAWECGKDPPVLLCFDPKYVSRIHRRQIYYNRVTDSTFTDERAKVAEELSVRQIPEIRIGERKEEEEPVESA